VTSDAPYASNSNAPFRARAILFVALVAALVALASSEPVHAAMLEIFQAAKQAIARHPVAGRAAFVVLAALSAMLAFFSSAVLVPPAVFAWGPMQTALLLWSGWMLGGITSYLLARWLGRPVLRWFSSGQSFTRYEERLRRGTSFPLVLLFQLALPSEIPGYVLGLVRYPVARYMAALAIAELPYALGTMLLGASFLERRIPVLLSLGAAAALAAVLLTRALGRQLE
jgi:uncharacterized membrane protein YdjX (TVP38/TMEM64 family)